MSSKSYTLFNKTVDSVESSEVITFPKEYHLSFMLISTGTLACTATVELSNDGTNFVASATTLTASGPTIDLEEMDTAASIVRVTLSGVTGTGNLVIKAHGKS